MSEYSLEDISKMVLNMRDACLEEFCKGYLAEVGCLPSEVELVQEACVENGNHKIKFYFRKREL